MTGQVTSPGVVRRVLGEWRAFGRFLRRPRLPERMTGIGLAPLAATLELFALDLVLMAVLLVVVGIASALGFHAPQNALGKLQLGPLWLIVIVVVAPITEELVFRGWLSGRPGPVGAVIVLLAGIALPIVSGMRGYPVLVLGSIALAAALAIGLLVWLRKRPALPGFARHFGWFYFAGALLFAAAHLFNYSQGSAAILLPLVVPQLLVGLILGYARVTYGLWSDILLHMMHNGLLIALVVLQKGLGG